MSEHTPDLDPGSTQSVALSSDEEMLYELRPAWTNYTRSIIIGVIGLVVVIGVYFLIQAYVKRQKTRYIITTERIIFEESGIIGGTNTEEFELANVEKTETHQSLLEDWLNVGTVTVTMRHEHHEAERFDVTIPSVKEYREVAQTLRE
jgi:hypothetical protein